GRGRGFSSDFNNQVLGGVEVELLPWRDDRGGAVFGEDGRAGIVFAGAQVFSGVETCFVLLTVELDCNFEMGEFGSGWADECVRRYTSRGGFQDGAEAQGYEFDFAGGMD